MLFRSSPRIRLRKRLAGESTSSAPSKSLYMSSSLFGNLRFRSAPSGVCVGELKELFEALTFTAGGAAFSGSWSLAVAKETARRPGRFKVPLAGAFSVAEAFVSGFEALRVEVSSFLLFAERGESSMARLSRLISIQYFLGTGHISTSFGRRNGM